MALVKPRSWREIEEDEAFQSLDPDRKLQVLDRWSQRARDFGVASGATADDAGLVKLQSFRDTKAQQFEALKAPPPEPSLGKVLSDQFASGNRAWGQGVEFISAATGLSSDLEASAQKISELERANQNVAQTEDMKKFQEAEGFLESAAQIITNPIDVALPLFAQSMGSQIAPMAAGAAIGAGAGALTGPGAAVTGLVGAGVGAGVGDAVVSFPDFIRAKGYDLADPEQVKAALNDPDVIAEAGKKSAVRGLVVGATSAVGGAVAGKPLSAAVAASAGKAVGERALKIGTGAVADAALQTGIEGLGEAGAQLASTGKLDPKEIAAEMFVQTPTQVAEIAIGTAARIKDTAPQTAAELEKKGIQKAQEAVGNAEILSSVDVVPDEANIEQQAEELDDTAEEDTKSATKVEAGTFVATKPADQQPALAAAQLPAQEQQIIPGTEVTLDSRIEALNRKKQDASRSALEVAGYKEDGTEILRNVTFGEQDQATLDELLEEKNKTAPAQTQLGDTATNETTPKLVTTTPAPVIETVSTASAPVVENTSTVPTSSTEAAPLPITESAPAQAVDKPATPLTQEEQFKRTDFRLWLNDQNDVARLRQLRDDNLQDGEKWVADMVEDRLVELGKLTRIDAQPTPSAPEMSNTQGPTSANQQAPVTEQPVSAQLPVAPIAEQTTPLAPVEAEQPAAPKQPAAPAPQPLAPELSAPTPDAQAYEDSLVAEAKNAGTKISGTTNKGIKDAIQGKGWYPKTNVNKAIREIKDRVQRRLEAEAPQAAQGTAPAPALDLPEGGPELIAETRSTNSVPSSATINQRFEGAPVEQRQAVRREAAKQVASDLGIEYSEELDFAKDFDGNDNIPIRVTQTGTEPVFVNNPEVTARQIDAGFTPVVPEAMRGRVVQGITFDADTGQVTSAIGRGVTTTQPGDLARGVRAQRPGTQSQATLATDKVRKNARPFFKKLNEQDQRDLDGIRVALQNRTASSQEIAAAFGPDDLIEAGLIKWARERVKDRTLAKDKRKNYSASQIWNFVMQDAAEKLKTMPRTVSLDAPITETGTMTRGDTVAAQDRMADRESSKDAADREAAIEEDDAIDEGVAADEPTNVSGPIGSASTGMNYDQAYNIVNSRVTQGFSKKAVAKLKAEAQELLNLAPQNVIDDLEANDVDYWTWTAEDFRNVDTGNTNQIVSSSPKQKTPYIAEQTSWMKSVARAMGVGNVSNFTPTQFTQLARFYADKFRPFFDQGDTTLPETAVAESLPEIRAVFEGPQGAASEYRAAVDRLRAQFPGAKITYSTGHNASAWYDPRFRNQIFLNPLLLEQELGGLSASEAQPFLRAVLNEEYKHMVRKLTISDDVVIAIAKRLSDAQRKNTIDSYVGSVDQYTDAAQRQEIIDGLDDLAIGDEYIRMLAQRLESGQTTEDLAPEKLPQNLFEQIKKYFAALISRLKARLTVARDPLLAHTINALEAGMRILEIEHQFENSPASVSRTDLVYARRRGQPVVDIDDIDATLPPGNGWLRPDGSWVAAETISAGDQVQGWEAEMGQFGGHEAAAMEFLSMNDPNAYALLQDALNSPDAFERGYEVVTDYMKRMGWLRVVQQDGDRIVFNGVANKAQEKALFTSAILEEKSLVADNGRRTETIYEPPTGGIVAARPGVRVRGKRVGQVQRKPGGLLSSGAFTTKERDIMLKASQKIAKATANAEFLVNEFRRAVKKAYGKNQVPTDLINQALGSTDNRLTDQQITDLKKIRDKDAREVQRLQYMRDNRDQARIDRRDALAQLPASVAKAVEAMGAKIDELSIAMMTEGYVSEDLIPVFEENLELYLHRSYAIFESPQWKDNMVRAGEIADAIREIKDPVERQKAISELPKTTREHVRVRVAFERFAVERAIAEYATEIRRKAKQNNQTLSRQQAIALAKADTDTISRKASDLVLRYLTVADQDAYRFFVQGRRIPGRRDLDVIKVRGQIPKELREFWGEVKNAETNFTQTVGKMSAFMAHHDVASELLNNGIAEGYIWKAGVSKDPNPNPEYVPLIPKGTASPDSISPLYGAYGPKELRDALVQMTQPQNTAGWARFMSFMTATAMAMKTIGYVPRSFVRNFLGNPLIVLGRGLYNLSDPLSMGKALADGFRVARLNAGLGGNTAYQALRERALELGVIGDNVRGTLLKKLYEESTEGEKINELLKRSEFDSALEKIGVRVGQGVYKGASKLADIYQGVDDIWKMYAWEMEQAKQKAAHPTWNKTQIEEAAAQNVRNLVPTYSLSPDLTQRIRRIPLFAPFITWTSEILRTTGNNIALGKQEIAEGYRTNNNAMVKNGASRLAGFLVATSVLPAFAMAMKAALGYDDEDEEAVRTSLRDWQKNAQLIFLGAKDQGKVSYLDLSYLDPNQVFVEPMIAASRAFKAGDSPFTAWASETLRPIYSEQLFIGAMVDIMRNRTADGRPIVNEQDTASNQLYGKMMHAVEAIGPGTLVTTVPNLVRGAQGEVSASGKVYSFGDEVYSAGFGQRISELDSQTTLRQAAGRFMSSNAEATRLLNDTLLSRGTVSVADIPAAYENANRAKREVFEQLRDNYNAAIKLGVPKAKAVATLRDMNVSQDLVAQVINDRYIDYTPSKQTLNEVISRPDGKKRLTTLRDYLLQKRKKDRDQDEG